MQAEIIPSNTGKNTNTRVAKGAKRSDRSRLPGRNGIGSGVRAAPISAFPTAKTLYMYSRCQLAHLTLRVVSPFTLPLRRRAKSSETGLKKWTPQRQVEVAISYSSCQWPGEFGYYQPRIRDLVGNLPECAVQSDAST